MSIILTSSKARQPENATTHHLRKRPGAEARGASFSTNIAHFGAARNLAVEKIFSRAEKKDGRKRRLFFGAIRPMGIIYEAKWCKPLRTPRHDGRYSNFINFWNHSFSISPSKNLKQLNFRHDLFFLICTV